MDEFRNVRHLVLFKTVQGEVFVGTNDLDELSAQVWFREFLNLRPQQVQSVRYEEPPRMSSPQPAPAPRPSPTSQRPMSGLPPRRQVAFSEYNPDTMTEQIWNGMTAEQQQAWMQFYGIQG